MALFSRDKARAAVAAIPSSSSSVQKHSRERGVRHVQAVVAAAERGAQAGGDLVLALFFCGWGGGGGEA
jgi:hypothetical protein